MSYENIVVTRDEGVGTIRLNRPKVLNALSRSLYREVDAAIGELEADERAPVAGHVVHVVAFLARVQVAVPAIFQPAVRITAVSRGGVAVVALLPAGCVQDAVSADLAGLDGALGRASVAGHVVAVVAFLAHVQVAVPAVFQAAIRVTAVSGCGIAVVTILARIENAVPAFLQRAVRATTVSRIGVAVVAFLAVAQDGVPASGPHH